MCNLCLFWSIPRLGHKKLSGKQKEEVEEKEKNRKGLNVCKRMEKRFRWIRSMERTTRTMACEDAGMRGKRDFSFLKGKKGKDTQGQERETMRNCCVHTHPKGDKSPLRFALFPLRWPFPSPSQYSHAFLCLSASLSCRYQELSFSIISDSSNDEMHIDLLSHALVRAQTDIRAMGDATDMGRGAVMMDGRKTVRLCPS